ncbi:Clytin-like [Oopsacas minuta]|uniref:Clytin-like n=1 Tax=Oopsacas minuta TaxID=111878 RepID=A0AAV7JNB8_9METZ|nr:Clytin-like [Oopsacas minuta]
MAEVQEQPKCTPTADDFLKDEKWRAKASNMFDALDKDKKGYVPFVFFENLIKSHETALKPEPEVALNVRKVLYEYAAALGFYPSTYQHKEEFVKNFASFMEKEVARVGRGEQSLLVKRNEVMFELVSKKENESIYKEESLLLGRANGNPDCHTHSLYEQLDKENTGKLDKKMLSKLTYDLWSNLEHTEEHNNLHGILKQK